MAAMANLAKLLGIDIPIIQAPMAGVQAGALAAAVSQAGGLGSLPCALLTPESDAQGAGARALAHLRTRST